MSHDDYGFEPIPGLPAEPPEGERILWRGQPRAMSLGRYLFNVRLIALYFGILAAWGAATAIADGRGVTDAVASVSWLLIMAAGAVGLFLFFAYLIARTTIYTITNRRLVMRIGVALPMTYNIPFAVIDAANLKEFADGSGNISVRLREGNNIAYLQLWPHARPWRFRRSEPSMRCVPKAREVARTLSDALAAFVAGEDAQSERVGSERAGTPARGTAEAAGQTTRSQSADGPGTDGSSRQPGTAHSGRQQPSAAE
jgi:hypothetical protein